MKKILLASALILGIVLSFFCMKNFLMVNRGEAHFAHPVTLEEICCTAGHTNETLQSLNTSFPLELPLLSAAVFFGAGALVRAIPYKALFLRPVLQKIPIQMPSKGIVKRE